MPSEITEQLCFALKEMMRVVEENPYIQMRYLQNGGVWQQAEDVIKRFKDAQGI